MALFGKETCAFCGAEVGMLKRTKMATKDYICNDCKRKTNFFARMDYTSKAAAQKMMDTMAQEEELFMQEYEGAENRFDSAERSWKSWVRNEVSYRRNSRTGKFQLKTGSMSSYEHVPVFTYERVMPYQFREEGKDPIVSRQREMLDESANYVRVDESRDSEGKVTDCTLIIPYDDNCIREIRIRIDIRLEGDLESVHDLADQMNEDRRVWIRRSTYDQQEKGQMQVRNLSDTVMAAAKAKLTGGDVMGALQQGMQMAEDIEEGKVKRGFFGKLLKKK